MRILKQFLKFWGAFWETKSWKREQSALWAIRHYDEEQRPVAAGVMFCIMDLAEDPNKLSPDSRFWDEIDMPDLQDVELVMAIEEDFAISIPDDDAANIHTVGELIKYVHARTTSRS